MAVKSSLGLFFKRGLRALLPTVLTIGVILIVVNFFSDNIVEPVNRSIRGFLVETSAGHVVMDAVFDVDAFLTFWAVEVLVAHMDGYSGNANNFYLYHDPTSGRLRFQPVVIEGEHLGSVGVLGPTRMNYPQALATVDVVSEQLGHRIEDG